MVSRKQLNWIMIIVLMAVVFGGLVWVNYQFANNNPGGNDFLPHYVGARALIFEGVSPYSEEVALEIQNLVFGRQAIPGENETRVVYPLYSILLFAPFALIGDYLLARVAWMIFLEISLIITAFMALKLFEWKPRLTMLGFYYLFSIFWYHAFRSLINGNAVILVGLMLAGTLYAIKAEKDKIAGLFLAFSTIKPNLVILVIIFILIWCLYQKRMQIIMWFFGSMVVLTLGGMLVIPNWILQNIWEILNYPAYNPAGSIADVIGNWFPGMGSIIKWMISGSLGLLLVYEWWIARKQGFHWFLWTVCITLLISQWIGIQTDPGNFIVLFTPFVMVIAFLDKRWNKFGSAAAVILMVIVLTGLWILFITTLNYDYQPAQSPLLYFPLPGIVLIGLYWIKWWVTDSKQILWSDIA